MIVVQVVTSGNLVSDCCNTLNSFASDQLRISVGVLKIAYVYKVSGEYQDKIPSEMHPKNAIIICLLSIVGFITTSS